MAANDLKHRFYPIFDGHGYLDGPKLFYAYFSQIPSIKRLRNVDTDRLLCWLEGNLTFVRKHTCSTERTSRSGSVVYTSQIHLYLLEDPVMIRVEDNWVTILYIEEKLQVVNRLMKSLRMFSIRESSNHIKLVVASGNQLETRAIHFSKPGLCLDTHYNDDLQHLHFSILNILRQANSSGLTLFHGAPGTGKSTYIRYLIGELDKDVIFITPELAGHLGSPEIASFLVDHANALFVIEDAEQLLVSRDAGRNSSISTILNLTDGILGESLGIQILATFNTNLQNIDPALLRKGRMRMLYEFKPLRAEKAEALLRARGVEGAVVTSEMTLAEIYHYGEEGFEIRQERQGIGFLGR